MVNPFTRAIMRPQAFMDALPGRLLPMPEEDCGAPEFKRLRLKPGEGGAEYAGDRTAVYSDIDGNGHVDQRPPTSISAMDLLPAEMAAREPAEVQVLSAGETLPGGNPPPLPPASQARRADIKGENGGKDSFGCSIRFR